MPGEYLCLILLHLGGIVLQGVLNPTSQTGPCSLRRMPPATAWTWYRPSGWSPCSWSLAWHQQRTSWPPRRGEGTHRPASPRHPRWSSPTGSGLGLRAATSWTPRTTQRGFAQPILHRLCSMTGGPHLAAAHTSHQGSRPPVTASRGSPWSPGTPWSPPLSLKGTTGASFTCHLTWHHRASSRRLGVWYC